MQLVEGTCVKMRVKSKNLKFILVLLKYDVDLHKVIGLIRIISKMVKMHLNFCQNPGNQNVIRVIQIRKKIAILVFSILLVFFQFSWITEKKAYKG